MALVLRNLYEETKQNYHLQLICGSGGLDNIVDWVYVSEDISTSAFLKGGELIITTGLSCDSDHWLADYVQALIARSTCGLILNTGVYLRDDGISEEVKALCEEHHFPLFTMPWEIHIFDITHDYYNRIFLDTQVGEKVNEAFLHLLHGHSHPEQSISLLEDYGFSAEHPYRICCLQIHPSSDSDSCRQKLRLYLERCIHRSGAHIHFCCLPRHFVLLLPGSPMRDIHELAHKHLTELQQSFPNVGFQIGLGSLASSLSGLGDSYRHACAAAALGISRREHFCAFDELGFFKILLSVRDRQILEQYIEEKLGTLIRYDEIHRTNYCETLHQYLLCNGSIQNIAAAMFCHRNTVNYRIRLMREELHLPLDDISARFEWMAAFQARDYLYSFPSKQ